MYTLIDNNQVVQYPYSVEQLKQDNPQVSFPVPFTESTLNNYNVYTVKATNQPQADNTKTISEANPVLIDGVWTQAWIVADATPEEMAARNEQIRQQRREAYEDEADPLFFKAQRGESTMEEWLAKVEEIKQRYPDSSI